MRGVQNDITSKPYLVGTGKQESIALQQSGQTIDLLARHDIFPLLTTYAPHSIARRSNKT